MRNGVLLAKIIIATTSDLFIITLLQTPCCKCLFLVITLDCTSSLHAGGLVIVDEALLYFLFDMIEFKLNLIYYH